MPPDNPDDRRLTAEQVFKPWELEGRSRRDCLPHRARLLRAMAYGSLIAGGLSLILILPGVVGLLLGLGACWMARRDLDLIRVGEMDTTGFHSTVAARADARGGALLSLVGLLIWSGLALYVVVIVLASIP